MKQHEIIYFTVWKINFVIASFLPGFLVHSGAHSQHPAMTSETSESSAVLLIAVIFSY